MQRSNFRHSLLMLVCVGSSTFWGCATTDVLYEKNSAQGVGQSPRQLLFWSQIELGMSVKKLQSALQHYAKAGHWSQESTRRVEGRLRDSWLLRLSFVPFNGGRLAVLKPRSEVRFVLDKKRERLVRMDLLSFGWSGATLAELAGQLRRLNAALTTRDQSAGRVQRLLLSDKSVSHALKYDPTRLYAGEGGVPEPTPVLQCTSVLLPQQAPVVNSSPAASPGPGKL